MNNLRYRYVRQSTRMYCKQHKDEEYTFVCSDCGDLLCDECICGKNHSSHEVNSMKMFFKEVDLKDLTKLSKKVDGIRIKSQIEEGTESRYAKVVTSTEERTTKLKVDIDKIKKKKLEDCEKMQLKNSTVINDFMSLVDLSKKINNLQTTGGRTQYVEVANALLCYRKAMDSDDEFEMDSSIFLPTFTEGNIQKTRLEKMFGKLDFEEEELDSLFTYSDDSSVVSSDDSSAVSSNDSSDENSDSSKSNEDEKSSE